MELTKHKHLINLPVTQHWSDPTSNIVLLLALSNNRRKGRNSLLEVEVGGHLLGFYTEYRV